MRNATVLCMVFAMLPLSAFAKGGVPTATPAKKVAPVAEKNVCIPKEKTPDEKCRERHGKWTDDMCVKTRVIRRVKVQMALPPAMPVENFELKCYRQGGEWRNGLCYGKNDQAPAVAPPLAPSISMKQEQSIVVKNTPPPAASNQIPPKKANGQWWWMGVGAFALGIYGKEMDFITGGLGKLVFAVNRRFRVAGLFGAGIGPWQESKPNILVGAEASIRLWNWLFLSAGLETVWGGFQGLSVHRRIFLAGIGPEFWIGERSSITLHFVFGVRDDVTSCATDLGKFAGGNLLQINLYF